MLTEKFRCFRRAHASQNSKFAKILVAYRKTLEKNHKKGRGRPPPHPLPKSAGGCFRRKSFFLILGFETTLDKLV